VLTGKVGRTVTSPAVVVVTLVPVAVAGVVVAMFGVDVGVTDPVAMLLNGVC